MRYRFLRISPVRSFDTVERNAPDGLFKQAILQDSPWREPRWKIATVMLGGHPVGVMDPRRQAVAAGASIQGGEAMARSLGEALERYCAFNYFQCEVPAMRKVDMEIGYVRCASYENAPKAFKDASTLPAIEHTTAIRLEDSHQTFLPYETQFLGYLKTKESSLFCSPISTGCAFHTDICNAIYQGILEALERDALMRWWHMGFPSIRRIAEESALSFSVVERVKRVRSAGLRLYFYEISDWTAYPVVLCLVQGDAYPYTSVGVSCSADIEHAMAKAMDEAVSIRAVALSRYTEWQDRRFTDFDWVSSLEDHMLLYAHWARSPIIERLLALPAEEVWVSDFPVGGGEKIDFSFLREFAQELRLEKGGTVYYKDLTLPEVRLYGHAVKVYVPEFIPLSQSMRVRWLGSLEKEGVESRSINPYPHPFS